MIAYKTYSQRHRLKSVVTYTNMVELFVYDFITATNNPSLSHIKYFLREMLHRVNSIFFLPNITKHQGQDPI